MDDSYHDFWAFDRPHVRKPPRPFLSRLVALGAASLLLVPIGIFLRQGDGRAVEAGSLPGAAVNLEASAKQATTTQAPADTGPSTAAAVGSTDAAAIATATETAADDAGTLPAEAGTLPEAIGTLPATVPTTAAPTTVAAAPRATAAATAAPSTGAPATTKAPATTRAPATTKAPAPRPTTAPTTAAPRTTTTAASRPPNTWPQSAVETIIRDVWPDDLEQRALEIAYRESRFVPTAHNGWCCYGLFQIYWEVHKSWIGALGYSLVDLYDPRVNAQLAYLIYQRAGGWGPWG